MLLSVNGRFRVHKAAGLQRYAEELLARFSGRVDVVQPKRKLKGVSGHAWEQFRLPGLAGPGLLWSPCNTGPVIHRRQVITIHDLFPLDHPDWFTPSFTRAYKAILPALTRRARRIIAVSEYTRQRLIERLKVPPEKVSVIHSGVGSQFHPCGASTVEAMHAALSLPSRKYFLSVSSLEPRKNVGAILAAWEQSLPYLAPDCWLVLAGGSGSQTVFSSLNLTRIPSRVFFTGYVEDRILPALYSGSIGFVFPSLAEGFGLPLLEAMRCGTPAITSNNSSLVEVAGGAAIQVDPADISSIARAIVQMASDAGVREALRELGLKQAARFSWDVAADKTWSVLETEQLALEELKYGIA
ncbi:MAG: glycosyltransferase family 4 protein [Acidobacteriota bacterium]|nr:glycosyltransferase family 4 protein [Acidobacteriota bacterium]